MEKKTLSNYKKNLSRLNKTKGKNKGVDNIPMAANGLQSVAVPEQGDVSNVLSSTSTMASAGSQFGLPGTVAGALVGLGTGLLQKRQQDKAHNDAVNRNDYLKSNRQASAVDESIDQKPQRFKSGGKVKSKTIEIEGKKTPEIHTDKDFNVKNLGTTPHSKGGNKVEAEEGDIVFNTQNSITKYNKIANAISNGNKGLLNKEKNKLPEDKTKAQYGTRLTDRPKPIKVGINYRPFMNPKAYTENMSEGGAAAAIPNKDGSITLSARSGKPLMARPRDSKFGYPVSPINNIGSKRPISTSPTRTNFVKAFDPFNTSSKSDPNRNYVTPNDFTLGAGGKGANNKTINPIVNKAITVDKSQGSKKTKPTSRYNKSGIPSLDSIKPNSSNLSNVDALDLDSNNRSPYGLNDLINPRSKTSSIIKDDTSNMSKTSNTSNNTASNIAQFAGVANNLYQGLKKEKPIKEEYYNPTKLEYNDRSQSLRNDSNAAAKVQESNARNVSGGSSSNLRANQNIAALSNLGRQNSIDEREISRRDDIANTNIQLDNQAKQINLGRKDAYQAQIDGTRAAKQAYIDQAASDIGQYGMAKQEENYMRSRDDKAYASQAAGLKAINSNGNFMFDENGNKTFRAYKKGTKSIKINKYKTK